jgi:hypothetical protein
MKIGISNFAKNRHIAGNGYSYFTGKSLADTGTDAELIALIEANWDKRTPGAGRTNLEQVVIVPLPAKRFRSATAQIHENIVLDAYFHRRQTFEEPFVKVTSRGDTVQAKYAKVVLYSAATLLENDGERSGDYDWEVVAIIAGDVQDEPMPPLTMARNFLEKAGGTKADYTAKEFAEAIYYWSSRVSVAPIERD